MKSAVAKNDDSGIRVVKIGNCPSLSGKSKLTYQVGSVGKGDVMFRVVANSAPGTFDPSWVSMEAIEEALAKVRKGEAVTAVALDHLFRGRSMNTPFFLFAALKDLGLFKRARDNPRGYEPGDVREFLTRVQAWARAPREAEAAPKTKKPKGEKAAPRKAPRKSQT